MAPPGRRRSVLSSVAFLFGLIFLFSSTASAASAVIGIDVGTEYIKAVLVKPGTPLEIVPTKDSKRKETSAIAFKPSKVGALPAGSFPERFYGSDAIALQARFPGDVYPNLKHLLGVSSESDVVGTYFGRYPALELARTEERPTVSFSSGIFAEGEKTFSVEEILAMELRNVRENAKAMAGKGYDVKDAVLTVPPFYTVEERRALEVAAQLAGLRVLGMVSDGLAVGLNYAMSRTFPDVTKNGKPEINLIFDMGAGSASATVLKFQGRTVKDVGKLNKTVQEVQVMGTGWDKTLGGDLLNSIIVEDMISSFVGLPAAKSASITAEKVKAHGRTAAKLFKEAERLRQMLSANTETTGFFESFFEDVDFRYKLSRSQLEALTAEYATRIDGPFYQALEVAGLSINDIESVIVHGGATRTPFVQSRLEAIAGKGKIRANVNSDEAAVFGTAFKAASISPSFRVKEIRDSDLQGYNHGIQYKFNSKERDQKIFTPNTKLGTVKDLPFQMMDDFEFTVYQATPGTTSGTLKTPVLQFRSGNLTSTATKMLDEDKCDRDTFNNYVQVRLSPTTGNPEIISAWITCEGEVEGAKGGIVDGVKNLFGMGGKKEQEPLKENESSSSSSRGSSSSSSAAAEGTNASEAGEKKKTTIKSTITYDVKQLGYEKRSRKEFQRMQDRLAAFDASDKSRRVREEVLNSLEAFTYRARDYLEDDSFVAASTSVVRSTLKKALSAASDWIYSGGAEATEKVLKEKLKELEDIVNPVLKRKDEALKRPEAITKLKESITHLNEIGESVVDQIKTQSIESSKSSEAVSKAYASPSPLSVDPLDELDESEPSTSAPAEPEISEVPTVYTDADLEQIKELTSKAQKWLNDNEAKQKKLKETDDPAFTVKDVEVEKKRLDDLTMEMMMKKMNYMKPPTDKAKVKPKAKPTKKKADKKPKKDKKVEDDAKQQNEQKEPRGADNEDLQDALRKVGVKLNLNDDLSEEEIADAIRKLAGTGRPHNEL